MTNHHDSGLEDEITDNVRGEFERFLVAVIQCQRDEGSELEKSIRMDGSIFDRMDGSIFGPDGFLTLQRTRHNRPRCRRRRRPRAL